MATAAGAVFPWLQQQGLCFRGYSSRGCVSVVTAAGAAMFIAGLRLHGYGRAASPWRCWLHFRGYCGAVFPWLPQGCVSMVTAGRCFHGHRRAVFPWLRHVAILMMYTNATICWHVVNMAVEALPWRCRGVAVALGGGLAEENGGQLAESGSRCGRHTQHV